MEFGIPGEQDVVPKAWQGDGNYWTGRGSDGSIVVNWSLGRSDGRRGELQAWYETGSAHRLNAIRLSLPDGLTPSTLSRFPWSRFLSIADNARVLWNSGQDFEIPQVFDSKEMKELERSVEAAREGRRPPRGRPTSSSRPGRRGHPDDFYMGVASEYVALRTAGKPNPTAELAKAHHVSRSTAAGWVAGARKRGHLPAGRPGRAG